MAESFAAMKMRPRSMVGIEYWCVPVLISHHGSVLPGSAARFRAAETMLGLEVPPQRNDAAEPSATDAARSGHAGSSDTKAAIPRNLRVEWIVTEHVPTGKRAESVSQARLKVKRRSG